MQERERLTSIFSRKSEDNLPETLAVRQEGNEVMKKFLKKM